MFLLLIALSASTAAVPAQERFIDPVNATIADLTAMVDQEYEARNFFTQWLYPSQGTADQKIAEVNQHIRALEEKDAKVLTKEEKATLADYKQLAQCIESNKAAAVKTLDFFVQNQKALNKIEASHGPQSKADYFLIEAALNAQLVNADQFDTCTENLQTDVAEPYAHIFGNTTNLEIQKNTVLEDQELLKMQKEALAQEADPHYQEVLFLREKIMEAAQLIEQSKSQQQSQSTNDILRLNKAIRQEAKKIQDELMTLKKQSSLNTNQQSKEKPTQKPESNTKAETTNTQPAKALKSEKAKAEAHNPSATDPLKSAELPSSWSFGFELSTTEGYEKWLTWASQLGTAFLAAIYATIATQVPC